MVMYTVACLFNILMDFVTTYMMSYEIMKGLGFRTYDGTKLADIPSFTDRFETYAMQRSLAENTFAYAFPSTYLIPFLIEPLVTIYVPFRIGLLIVRTHPEILGRAAEGWLVSMPMEMGRYADILLDVVLAILIFFFPGGYTHTLFFALVGSHIFIYAFDHYRVLRTIPTSIFASMDIDWWSQARLAPICGLILSCLVFKANCQGYGYCLEGMRLIVACTAAFLGHVIVHLLMLIYVVPVFGNLHVESACQTTYKDMNEKFACSWFTANPVHCLRSRHIYQHEPPCGFYVSGQEHLLALNPTIGCHFHDKSADVEDYGDMGVMKSIGELRAGLNARIVSTRGKFGGGASGNQPGGALGGAADLLHSARSVLSTSSLGTSADGMSARYDPVDGSRTV